MGRIPATGMAGLAQSRMRKAPVGPPAGAVRAPIQAPASVANVQKPVGMLGKNPAGGTMGGLPTSPQAPAPGNPMNPLFDQMLAKNQEMRGSLQDIGQRNINALQRRNGANAAMSGMGMGSGYLSGQRSALTQGLGQMNKDLLGNDQQRMDILMRQASEQMTDQRSQTAFDRAKEMQDRGFQREDAKDKAGADAERDQGIRDSKGNQWMDQFKSVTGGDPNHPSHAWFKQMVEEYRRTGDPAKAQQIQIALNTAARDMAEGSTTRGGVTVQNGAGQ